MKMQWTTYLALLLPIIVPVIVSQLKKFIAGHPNLYWIIPASTPVLGALLDWLQSFVTNTSLGPTQAAILGAVGVAVRELLNQIRLSVPAGTPGAKPE